MELMNLRFNSLEPLFFENFDGGKFVVELAVKASSMPNTVGRYEGR